MNKKMNDKVTAGEKTKVRLYASPTLRNFGKLKQVTLGSGGFDADSLQGQPDGS